MESSASHSGQQWRPDLQGQIVTGAGEALILIYPIATASTGLDTQIREVSEITDLDVYTVRQKLIGSSIDVLCAGNDIQRLSDVTSALTEAGYQATCILKSDLWRNGQYTRAVSARLEPDSDGAITFLDIKGTQALRWRPESARLVVAGSLTPEHYGTSKALLASLYGGTPASLDSTQERLRDISKHQPGLILVSETEAPVFIDGSMFNYEFMGERRSFSQAQNFLALVEALQSSTQSGHIHVDTDFGQKTLPIGRLATKPRSKSDTQKALALYAKLINLAQRQGFFKTQSRIPKAGTFIPQSISASHGVEALAQAAVAGAPGLLRRETGRPLAAANQSRGAQNQSTPLPPPPSGPSHSGGQDDLRTLVTNAQRLGPPSLIVSCVILALALAMAATMHQEKISMYWSFLPMGIALCVASVTYARRKGMISRLPTSRIRSMPMGLVEVKGKARRKYALQAPHSLMKCVHYSYRILERKAGALASGANTASWRVISRGDSGRIPFYVEDETARALVNPAGAVISGAQTNEYTSSLADMLAGVAPQPDRRIIETVIPENAELYIIGHAHPTAQDPDTRREEYRERLKALKGDPNLLAEYDADGDGSISFEEWALAKADLDDRLLEERLQAGTQRDAVVIGRHPGAGIFYISTKKESDILSSYHWKIPALGAAGFAFLAKGLWELFGR